MNILKRFVAAAIVVCLLLSFAGCHPKGEVAVTVGDFEFTSSYYMCALIAADTEAKGIVDEDARTNDKIDTNKEGYYYKQKIEGKKFEEYVKDSAVENLTKIAAYKTLCKKAKVEIGEEDSANIDYYVEYYWSGYGQSALYEANGVSKETYRDYMRDTYYSGLYFEHLYSKGGEKEIPEEDVKTNFLNNYIIANVMVADFAYLKDDEKTEKTEQMNKYLDELKAGTRTFEEIYKEFNKITEDETTTEDKDDHEDHDHEEEETEGEKEDKITEPKDSYAQVIGSEDTDYYYEHYETIKAMATGEMKLIDEDGEALILVVKQDIEADPYYLQELDLTVRHALKDDEYNKMVDELVKTLKVTVDDYAVDRFKVKKIKYPEVV